MNNKLKNLILTSSLAAFAYSANAIAADSKSAAAGYLAKGKELMAMINSGKIEMPKAESLVKGITEDAKVIVENFARKDPKADKLVKLIVSNIANFEKMTFEKLLKDWHDGGAIDPKSVGIDITKEENEGYTDAAHTVLHPIMALAALKKNDLKTAKEQLNEGMEQASNAAK